MNLSGGRCFCLMLGLSLLAHGGLFLNRSPLATNGLLLPPYS